MKNYLPPLPESKIELWFPKSTVDTQILETHTKKLHIYHSLGGISQNLGPAVVIDSSVLPETNRNLELELPEPFFPETGSGSGTAGTNF